MAAEANHVHQLEQFPKRTYAAPKLIQYGSLRQMTLHTGSSGHWDHCLLCYHHKTA
jgi:hypothetical protein